MQILALIDSYIGYVYILMAIVILVLLLRLMKKAGNINVTMQPVNNGIRHISKGMEEDRKSVV